MKNHYYSNLIPKSLRRLPVTLAALGLSLALQSAAQAQTTLTYTNTAADTWLTPASWSPSNDWGTGAVKTNAVSTNVRLNIPSAGTVTVTYTAAMGVTILDNTGQASRNMMIANGSGTTGAVNITGGTFVIIPPASLPSAVGAPGGAGAGQATLNLSGGNFICTNAMGGGILDVPFRGGSASGGANFYNAYFNINSGSTGVVDQIAYGDAGNLSGANAGAQCIGTVNINAGGTLMTRSFRANDHDSSQLASIVNFNGGTLVVMPNTTANAFISDAGTNLAVNVQSGGAVVDTAGSSATIAKPLLDAGGGGGLTKNGNGTLTLSAGGSTYTGPTVVNAGGLVLTLPMHSSALTLANGTTNSITVSNNSWTNTVTSVTNATINLALGAASVAPNSTVAVISTATLNASGVNVINITSGFGLPTGKVKLIDYTSSANRFGGGTFTLGTLPAGLDATLVDGPNDVSLNVTSSVQALVWSGTFDNIWATNGVLDWNGGTAAYNEYPNGSGDAVTFDDTAGSFYTVNVTNDVHPFSVTMNVTNAAVTIGGTAAITGSAAVTKNGTGTVLWEGTNSYAGGTMINAGILQIGPGGTLGSGGATVASGGTLTLGDGFNDGGSTVSGETVTINGAGVGGSLGALRGAGDAGPNVWAGPIVIGANGSRIGTEISGSLTVAGNITDNGHNYVLVYRPATGGTVLITSTGNTYGATRTYGSTIKLGVNNAFSTNELQIGAGTIDLNGFNQTVGGITDNSGPGMVLNNGGGTSILTDYTRTNGFSDSSASVIQDGSAPISLVVQGGGQQILTGDSTYTGNTVINGGELRINGSLGNTAVAVNSGGTLRGIGTIAGTITNNIGGTLAPGANAIGTFTNSSTVIMNTGSTNFFRLNAASVTSDQLVAGTVNYGGNLVVTNLSATALTVGQVFQLVNATTPNGNFDSVVIQNGGTGHFTPATGQLTIDTVPVLPQPSITQVTYSGGNLILQGTNGALSGTYSILTSTNVALPLASWTTNMTGVFSASGTFSNAIPAGSDPQSFFLLKQP